MAAADMFSEDEWEVKKPGKKRALCREVSEKFDRLKINCSPKVFFTGIKTDAWLSASL